MDRVIVFVDCASTFAAAEREGLAVDTAALVGYLANPAEGRMLVEAFAYLAVDPRHEREADITLDALWSQGYLVRHRIGTIEGGALSCDLAVDIALDMARAAWEMTPDTVVLVTVDERLVPAVLALRGKGVRVEVASFGRSASRMLRQRCSGFIDLGALAAGTVEEPVGTEGNVRSPQGPEEVWVEVT